MQVCSTEFVYHALFNPQDGMVESILENGLRPLSDFPESERWQQIQAEIPGFFETLYNNFAKPVIQRPYQNAGVFVSPIDFRLLPGTYLHDKTRFRIPISRIDPATACLTYEWEGKRSR
ncbi:MAG: hypothetical protein GY943_19710, partial [Chloroflexi bacterium]|nr:hypothetical protein [Chloroflexota bacterium]